MVYKSNENIKRSIKKILWSFSCTSSVICWNSCLQSNWKST